MTRLSGIWLLAVSLVLWALAVWYFGAPLPVETESAAEVPGKATLQAGTGASESAGTEATTEPSSAASASQSVAAPTNPAPATSDPLPQSASVRTDTVSSPSPAGAQAIPAPGTRAPAKRDLASGAASVADSSIVPGAPATGGTGASARGPDAPPAPASLQPWLGHPSSRPPPPARSDYSAADGNTAEAQLNAARRAAWEGQFADALARYRAAARLRPDDYAVWGEMGNVLWTMRRWSEAAYALEGAATLLVRAGELRAASELIPAVGRIDPDAAYRVQRLLWTATQRQSG